MDDHDLLEAYVRHCSEEAFASLTRRYVDLVYSASLRQLRDPEAAKDATQSVFLILARKAGSISRRIVLSGWLYRTAQYVSREASRAQNRRRIREASLMQIHENMAPESPNESWRRISLHLDDSMEKLSDSDRTAILLRFFHGKSFREISAILDVGEEAAKKRVLRALERLRKRLVRHGITDSSAAIGAALAVFAVQQAPDVVASTIAAALHTGTAIGAGDVLTKGILHMVTATKIKLGAATAAILLLTAATTSVSIRHSQAIEKRDTLGLERQKFALRAAQEEQQNQRVYATLQNENQELRRQTSELYKLRSAVSQLRNGPISRAPSQAGGVPPELHDRAEALREAQFETFMAAGQKALLQAPLSGEERLEYNEEINFMKNIGLALRIYATDHGDEFPDRFEQLLGTGLLPAVFEKRVQDSRYEYNHFQRAESKPGLPAVWWRAPDQRGIRVLVLTDGSAQFIREPPGVETPGTFPGIN